MNVRLIVPRRADGGHRDHLWAFCEAYWRKDFPVAAIVEGHHDGGPFNRSAAINQAAEGEWDVAVILDGDTILDAELVEQAAESAYRTGKLVLPFRARHMLNKQGTRRILAGHHGAWDRFVQQTIGTKHVSSCVVVPRDLWDEIGGFDERFEGWGGEDDAFHAACNALAGVERLRGAAWHLWHETSPWRDHRSPLYRQALALSDRYVAARGDTEAMRKLLAEPRMPDATAVVVLTTGTRETLAQTIASAEDSVRGSVGRWVICLDAGTAARRREIAADFPRWDVELLRGRGGYAHAVGNAIEVALGCGQPWIFWLEDDFTFERPVRLDEMQRLIDGHGLAQLSLMRQAWYPHEVAAGSVIGAKPDAFTQREGYVEHADYWTMNPMLARRSFLAEHRWPRRKGAERRFGEEVFTNGTRAGILGCLDDPPHVTHIGADRAGHGY